MRRAAFVDSINELLDARGQRLLYETQLRASAGSIAANIRDAYGRREGSSTESVPETCPRLSRGNRRTLAKQFRRT